MWVVLKGKSRSRQIQQGRDTDRIVWRVVRHGARHSSRCLLKE
jgi:hypothetical protein